MSATLLNTALALVRELATVPGALDAIRCELAALEALAGSMEVGVDGRLSLAKKNRPKRQLTFAGLAKKKKWNQGDVQAAARLFGPDKLPKGMYALLMGHKKK